MTVTGTLELVAIDAPDIERLASFYAQLTGWEIVRKDEGWTTMRAGDGQEIAFQLAPDHVAPEWPGQERPQQVHLDIFVEGREAAAERAVALGATRLAEGVAADLQGKTDVLFSPRLRLLPPSVELGGRDQVVRVGPTVGGTDNPGGFARVGLQIDVNPEGRGSGLVGRLTIGVDVDREGRACGGSAGWECRF